MLKRLFRIVSKLKTIIWIKIKERKFEKDLKYLFFDNHSDCLLIVFSAFDTDNRRRYNFVRGLSNCHCDRLYILDPWGFKGSYNMYENGNDYPERITNKLIDTFIKRGYQRIITAGSSKGGTCALYFGLNHHADEIFTGACQYNLGSYLHRSDHEAIFRGMMGQNASDLECRLLNEKLPKCLESNSNSLSKVHVFYSKNELTYERQIIDLVAKLKECNIQYLEIESDFVNHEDVGKPFLAYLLQHIQ